MKNIRVFYLKIFSFGGKISLYLNRRVFIMYSSKTETETPVFTFFYVFGASKSVHFN